ncbi:COP9 signalosome complex subunit 5 [Strigomonas culicis]|uniref:COP9 signalosome complex subunit 5 n=1 Tax=Strigomonas culicis TaxID=28005 RepID=S9THB2_9TRYP|nr:COP9 signalosome complex subunit 5 [Strigomonas culicis]|eukprot:EPY15728.1 COP9 signalosome complex subunit 5 [Strigomonas culicis]
MRAAPPAPTPDSTPPPNAPSLATDPAATADLPPEDLRWLLNAHNNAQLTSDAYWVPDAAHMDATRKTKPWRKDEDYFKEVKLSLLAALRMFIHSMRGAPDPRRGTMDWFEVMGLLVGHYQDGVLYVMDSFALPVEASQVECCMTQESQIHMADQLSKYRALGRPDRGCIGWYHTHPGYTCFLSRIDVDTQQQSQRVMDPYVALVLDPVHTLSTGELHVKAFRTYTEPVALQKLEEMQTKGGRGETGGRMEVPSERIKERGKFAHYYYDLPITLVRSSADAAQLDALVAQYWGQFFASNALLANQVSARSA